MDTTETQEPINKPSRRRKKKPRYDFLKNEWIEETDDCEEMDWMEEEE